MTREEIYQKIKDAKDALKPSHPDAATVLTVVKPDTAAQYDKVARRILGVRSEDKIEWPKNANVVINVISASKANSTLRKNARAIRHVMLNRLNNLIKQIDTLQREGNWHKIEATLSDDRFDALVTLTKMMPADYATAESYAPRKGKKSSLRGLPLDWREQVAAASKGQFHIPTLVCLMTGCRPKELVLGVELMRTADGIIVDINGAKLTETSGQEFRQFRLADHPITDLLIQYMDAQKDTDRFLVKVNKGNSVTTHMRNIGEKLWPKRKSLITVYTARHAMAADCKFAIKYENADKDLVSMVLGHCVDETKSYYGNQSQSRGISVKPTEVMTPRPIKQKAANRNINRIANGKLPRKSKSNKPIKN